MEIGPTSGRNLPKNVFKKKTNENSSFLSAPLYLIHSTMEPLLC